MSKPTSPTADHKARTRPKTLKLYTYGDLEFLLHPGGLPPRKFNINWMKEVPSANASDRKLKNEDADEDCRRR